MAIYLRLALTRKDLAAMDFLSFSEKLWLLGLLMIAATVLYVTLKWTSSRPLLARGKLCCRKDPTARTPPRSCSPDKNDMTSPTVPSGYNDALPPQRRHVLSELKYGAIPVHSVDEREVRRNILPMSADYMTSPDDKYTPMGFSVSEIKALGDFPDYATLSGLPLPSPYAEFDIEKALPRPYRPFRWAYHQTMCMPHGKLDKRKLKLILFLLIYDSFGQTGNGLVDRARKYIQEPHRPAQRPLCQERQTSTRCHARLRTSMQRVDGDGPAIYLRSIPAILHACR